MRTAQRINIRGESYRQQDRRKAGLVAPRVQEGVEAAAHSLVSDSLTPKTRQKSGAGSTPSEAKEEGHSLSSGVGNFQPELKLLQEIIVAALDATEIGTACLRVSRVKGL